MFYLYTQVIMLFKKFLLPICSQKKRLVSILKHLVMMMLVCGFLCFFVCSRSIRISEFEPNPYGFVFDPANVSVGIEWYAGGDLGDARLDYS